MYLTRINIQNIKEFIQLNNKKTQTIQFKKWAGDMNKHFSKDIQDGQQAQERRSTSEIIMETQIKTKMRYDLTPTRMGIIKKTRNNKCR